MLLNACDNHGQNIVAKCRQLSKIGGSLKCFTPDVLQFSNTTVEIQSFWGFSWKLGFSWNPKP